MVRGVGVGVRGLRKRVGTEGLVKTGSPTRIVDEKERSWGRCKTSVGTELLCSLQLLSDLRRRRIRVCGKLLQMRLKRDPKYGAK